MEDFIYKDKKMLRCGYTTGTCAALAARAAVAFLITGHWGSEMEIVTPKGKTVTAPILECCNGPGFAECAVKKDAGDDYDVTDGLLIFARAEFISTDTAASSVTDMSASGGEDMENSGDSGEFTAVSGAAKGAAAVIIDGGTGVGRVTKPGLNQPVGAAAINSVPRQMIRDAVTEVMEECGLVRSVKITISVPAGEEAAKKTFNPVLGITGGISILGTSGIVEPMSEEALVDTIRAHMKVLRAEGRSYMAAVPGNMGAGFLNRYLKEQYPEYKESLPMVTCSNFIGKTIDMAAELGFSGLLISGHLGKLVKLGNGIMNTHSKEGDGRMDTLVSCALTAGASLACLKRVQGSNTTEEAMEILKAEGLFQETVKVLCRRIDTHVKRRASDSLRTGVLLFDAGAGVIGMTDGALELLDMAVAENLSVTERLAVSENLAAISRKER